MANVVRANRELEDRARFGLGTDDQDDDVTEVPLTAEGVSTVSDFEVDTLAVGDTGDIEGITITSFETPEMNLDTKFSSSVTYSGEGGLYDGGGGTDVATAGIFQLTVDRTAAYTDGNDQGDPYALFAEGVLSNSPPGGFGYVQGIYGSAWIEKPNDDGASGVAIGGQAFAAAGAGNIVNLIGALGDVIVKPGYAKTVTNAWGVRARLLAFDGTITNAIGVGIEPFADATTTYTNHIGLKIGDFSVEGDTISRNIWSVGATSQNYFQGHVEIDGELNHDGAAVGFYGTAPIAKQTGVTVDAAGIHAALVALGLIGA